jgi:hypothetical protein
MVRLLPDMQATDVPIFALFSPSSIGGQLLYTVQRKERHGPLTVMIQAELFLQGREVDCRRVYRNARVSVSACCDEAGRCSAFAALSLAL